LITAPVPVTLLRDSKSDPGHCIYQNTFVQKRILKFWLHKIDSIVIFITNDLGPTLSKPLLISEEREICAPTRAQGIVDLFKILDSGILSQMSEQTNRDGSVETSINNPKWKGRRCVIIIAIPE
jgi:hypothetical protein